MSIMSYNGGAVMAMKGKNCVAIAADCRFGIQAQMVATDFQKIFPMGDRLFIGLAGLATDVQTVAQRLKFRLNLYELKEGRQIKPQTLMSMVSNLLYERRFGPYYTEPVIAGLNPVTYEPFICSLDLIGCPMITDDFVVSGTCTEQMYGMCESLWEPDMEPDHLFETIGQSMLNAVDRDAVSGMGVIVHVIMSYYMALSRIAVDIQCEIRSKVSKSASDLTWSSFPCQLETAEENIPLSSGSTSKVVIKELRMGNGAS
ncbi:putative Proteasome subunit beta type protein [Naja naja]|nr:putative Proteasome subunit beta type protein [Naja naja]